MKKLFVAAFALTALTLALGMGGCLLEDRELEVVLNTEHCEPFVEDHGSEDYTTPADIELGADLDSILADNDVSRADILDANLVSGAYEILAFEHDHNWTISGSITVERTDGGGTSPVILIEYDSVSLEDELGVKTFVTLNAAGVEVVNDAMDDFIAGGSPSLRLTVVSGDVIPDPTPEDRLQFIWQSCLNIQVIYELDTEVFNFIGG